MSSMPTTTPATSRLMALICALRSWSLVVPSLAASRMTSMSQFMNSGMASIGSGSRATQ